MTDSPRTVIDFPKKPRKLDCQGERSAPNVFHMAQPAPGFGIDAETAAKLAFARAQGRARRVAQEKIMDGYMELIGATSVDEANRFLQELLDRARGEAS